MARNKVSREQNILLFSADQIRKLRELGLVTTHDEGVSSNQRHRLWQMRANPYWYLQPRVPAGQTEGGRWTSVAVDAEEYPDAIKPVYPELLILPFLTNARIILAFEKFILARRLSAKWTFGKHKSKEKWARQIEQRNWTPQEITRIIRNGTSYQVANRVNPSNKARQYTDPKSGRFVVIDESNGELLQISGNRFSDNPKIGQ